PFLYHSYRSAVTPDLSVTVLFVGILIRPGPRRCVVPATSVFGFAGFTSVTMIASDHGSQSDSEGLADFLLNRPRYVPGFIAINSDPISPVIISPSYSH